MRRIVGLIATVLAIGLLASSNVPPLRVDCPTDGMTVDVCHDTVDATLRRGLAGPHPLILAARVEPGPADLASYGHRATVTYDLLGIPSPTTVRLYYDLGGHWGGESDRSSFEVTAWWAVPAILLLLVAGTLMTRDRRARRRVTTA